LNCKFTLYGRREPRGCNSPKVVQKKNLCLLSELLDFQN
jgi:hypothetical protein